MVVYNYEFPKLIYDILGGRAYSIGLHGVDSKRLYELTGIPREEVDSALETIRENGLKIFSSRSINGTVAFQGRIDDFENLPKVSDGLRGYRYGDVNKYVLVAIPTVIKDKNGNCIYIGKTNLDIDDKRLLDTTGNEKSAICDEVIPTEDNVIPSEYILGTYSILPDGKIDFTLNPKHVSKKCGIVSDEEFKRIEKKYNVITFNENAAADVLRKENLTEVDRMLISSYITFYSKEIRENSRLYLIPLVETLKQLFKEDSIRKVKLEDIDAINRKPEKIDYQKFYEGKTGEDLFYEQFRVIKSMQVEMFRQDGQTYIHSDRDEEAEEFYRLLNDKDFVKGLIKYRGKWDVISFSYYIMNLSSNELLSDPEIYNALFKYNSYSADDYAKKGLLTRDMLMDIASKSNFTSDTLYYLPKEYCDDLDLILTFVDNANPNNFRFGEGFGVRKFTFNNLSEEVRSNPVLYERINKRALELNETCGTNFELLDVDNEISLGMGAHK